MPELSFEEVGEILRLLESIDGAEVELAWGDLKIEVRHAAAAQHPSRYGDAAFAPPLSRPEGSPATPVGSQAQGASQSEPEDDSTAGPPPQEEPGQGQCAVSAPMAGTFYRSAKPGEPAFVEVGDKVEPGDTLALIEVMKLFTELQAEVGRSVARIDATDGVLVEFGQPLIWIDPT